MKGCYWKHFSCVICYFESVSAICIYSKVDDKRKKSSNMDMSPFMRLFWLTLRISKENNMEMSIIFLNKHLALDFFPKVLLTLVSLQQVRSQQEESDLLLSSYLQKEEVVSRRFFLYSIFSQVGKIANYD